MPSFFAFHDESSGQFHAVPGHDAVNVAHTELSMSQTTTL
jgi:hypothetical protein